MTRTFLVLLILFTGVISFAQSDEEPMFKVVKSKADRSLKQDECSINLHVEDSKGKALKASIQLSYNGKKRSISTDEKGRGSYTLKPGKYYLTFFYNENHYTIKMDSIQLEPGNCTTIDLKFRSSVLLSW